MSSISISYDQNSSLWSHFVSHAHLGLSKNIQLHRANLTEKIGDAILWSVEEFPGIVWRGIKDARVMTVALTMLALLANSFLFYPFRTLTNLKDFIKWLPLPPLWAVRFGAYIFTSAIIIGYGLRAFGRFSNHELMNEFYHARANRL